MEHSVVGGRVIDLIPHESSGDVCFLSIVLSSASLDLTFVADSLPQNTTFAFKYQIFNFVIRSQPFSQLHIPKLPTDKVTFALRAPRHLFSCNLPSLTVELVTNTNIVLATTSFNLSSLSTTSSLTSTCPFSFHEEHRFLDPNTSQSATLTVSLWFQWQEKVEPNTEVDSGSLALPPGNTSFPRSYDEVNQWKEKELKKIKSYFMEIEKNRLNAIQREWHLRCQDKTLEFESRLRRISKRDLEVEQSTMEVLGKKENIELNISKIQQSVERFEFYKQRYQEVEKKRRELDEILTKIKSKVQNSEETELLSQLDKLRRRKTQVSQSIAKLESELDFNRTKLNNLARQLVFLKKRLESRRSLESNLDIIDEFKSIKQAILSLK
ncbi:hypothetical protein P9112_000321 [Eukaryota sp. TZLM1-RC]